MKRGSSTVAVTSQLVITGANLGVGVILARCTTVATRGNVALASVLTTFAVVAAAAGIPELQVSRRAIFRPARLRLISFTVIATATCLLAASAYGSAGDWSGMGALATVVILSTATAFAMSELQVRDGAGRANMFRALHTLLLLLSLIAVSLAFEFRAVPDVSVYWSWAAAEVCTLTILTVTLRRRERPHAHQICSADHGSAFLHAGSQFANTLTDRGLILAGATAGSAPAIGFLAVAQSALAPITLPVQAFGQSLIEEPGETAVRIRRPFPLRLSYAMAAAIGAGGLALVAWLSYGFLVPAIFGPAYAAVGQSAAAIAVAGALMACWRVLHLRARGRHKPGRALISDGFAFLAVVVLFLTGVLNNPQSVGLALAIYAGVGFVSLLLQDVGARTRGWFRSMRDVAARGRNLLKSVRPISLLPPVVAAAAATAISLSGIGSIGAAVLIAGLVIVAVLVMRRASGQGLDKFEPLTIFAASFALLFILRPVYATIRDGFAAGFLGFDVPAAYATAVLVGAVGFGAFGVGYSMRLPRTLALRLPQLNEATRLRAPLLVNAVVLAFSLACFALFLRQNGGIGFLSTLLSGRSQATSQVFKQSSGYLYGAPQLVGGAALWLACVGIQRKQWKYALLGAAELFYSVILALGSGSRSYLLPTLVTVVIAAYLLAGRRPRILTIAVALVAIYVLGVTLPRTYRDTNYNAHGKSYVMQQTLDSQASLDEFALGQDTAMVDALSIEIDKVPQQFPHRWGTTYLEALARPIPKALYPNKPVSADQELNANLFPHTYHRGLGVSFSVFGEPWLNAGWLGVIAVLWMFGVAAATLWYWFKSRSPNVNTIAVFAFCVPYMFVFMRGGFGVDYQRLLFPLIPLLIIAWLSSSQATSREVAYTTGTT